MLACLASFVDQTAGADELVTLDRGGDTWYDSQDGTTIGVYASYADTLSTEQGAETPEQHVASSTTRQRFQPSPAARRPCTWTRC
jgi:hypothetical protein